MDRREGISQGALIGAAIGVVACVPVLPMPFGTIETVSAFFMAVFVYMAIGAIVGAVRILKTVTRAAEGAVMGAWIGVTATACSFIINLFVDASEGIIVSLFVHGISGLIFGAAAGALMGAVIGVLKRLRAKEE